MGVNLGRVVPLYKGQYSPEATYGLNHIVSFNGSLYWHRGREDTTGTEPADGEVWAVVFDGAEIERLIDEAAGNVSELVNDAGAEQIAAIEQKGAEVIDSIPDDYAELAGSVDEISNFCETLGYVHDIVISKDFINGTWANGVYRTDGNYGNYYRTARELIDIRDFTLKVDADSVDNLIYAWSAFSDTGSFIGSQSGGFGYMQNGVVDILTQTVKATYPAAKKVSISVGSYNGSSFVPFPNNINISAFYQSNSGKKIIDRVAKLEQSVSHIRQSFTNYLFPRNGKNTINLIGDSISQGVFSDDVSNDSCVGILRHMIRKDLGGKLNYGFIPFNIQNGFGNNWWVAAPLIIGTRGNAVLENNGRYYGVQGYKIVDETDFRFRVHMDDFSKFRIAYLRGFNAVLQVKKRKAGIDTILGTIDCNGATVEGAYSQVFDMGDRNDSATNIYINMISGTEAHISGIEIIQDEGFQTFNNYALAGASTQSQDDATIAKEANDSDFLIWALGYNDRFNVDTFRANIARYIPIIKAAKCEVIVVDFQWDASNGCKAVLRDMASQLGCLYLDMLELAPKKADGSIIPGFLNADGTHPDAIGHRYIAECIAKHIGLSCNTKPAALES